MTSKQQEHRNNRNAARARNTLAHQKIYIISEAGQILETVTRNITYTGGRPFVNYHKTYRQVYKSLTMEGYYMRRYD